MALKLMAKPLTASLKEHLKADPSKLHRAAPPTATQLGIKLVPAPAKEPAEPMATKKKHGNRFAAEFKATAVARALKAKETGEETVGAIAKELGIHGSNIYNWIAAAKKANGATGPANGKTKGKTDDLRGSDLNTLSRELSQAMDRVTAIKKRMRKLLETD